MWLTHSSTDNSRDGHGFKFRMVIRLLKWILQNILEFDPLDDFNNAFGMSLSVNAKIEKVNLCALVRVLAKNKLLHVCNNFMYNFESKL